MFTGIISTIGIIESSEQQGDLRIKITSDMKPESLHPGDSIAVNGACLTIIAKGFMASGKSYFTASLSAETIERTVPGDWEKGRRVSLERSLKVGDTLDGHLVSGHVDGLGTIRSITPAGDSHIMEVEIPENLLHFIAEKGSITLAGVSLTVNKVEGNHLWVNIIPYTWSATTLSDKLPGDRLNIEIDMIARYVARLVDFKNHV